MRVAPSSLGRLAACPGSYAAEKQCAYSEASPAAAEGNLLHAAMRPGADLSNLTLEHKRLVECAREHGRLLYMEWLSVPVSWHAEISAVARLNGEHTVSGRLDWIGQDERNVLVIDWKFGRSYVEVAPDNLQLRAYAVIGNDFKGPRDNERVVVAIVQPTVESNLQVTACVYLPHDIEAAREQLIKIADAASQPDAPRSPGEHCRYCKALGTALCPESVEQASALARFERTDLLPVGEELAAWLDKCAVAEQYIDMIRSHARELLANGQEIPGWVLKPDTPIRTIPDAAAAWAQVHEVMSPEEFMGLCKVGVGDLQSAVAKKYGWPAKVARREFDALMGAAIAAGSRRGALERSRA